MMPTDALTTIIRPTLASLGPAFDSPQAECLLLAIGLQESGFKTRQQDNGPAHGFWQFEIEAVVNFYAHGTAALIHAVNDVMPGLNAHEMYALLPGSSADRPACIMARDLLYRDPDRLPEIGDWESAWWYYHRNWRPGKPSITRWQDNAYPRAVRICRAG